MTIKKVFILVLTVVLSYNFISAQNLNTRNKKHQISFGIGLSNDFFTDISLVGIFDNIFDEILNNPIDESTSAPKRSGLFLNYTYSINSRWAIGTTVFYKYYSRERIRNDVEATYREHFVGAAVEGQFSYLNLRVFRLYSMVGLGLYNYRQRLEVNETTMREKDSHISTKFAYQVSPLCMEVGKSIGLKMEYGYGYKGIATLGFYCKF